MRDAERKIPNEQKTKNMKKEIAITSLEIIGKKDKKKHEKELMRNRERKIKRKKIN